MKWIGQHIWSLITRFRNTIYIENISTDNNVPANSHLALDSNNKVVKTSGGGGGGGLSTEEVQDIVGAMFTGNTETRISATYEDGDGTIDLVVDDMTADTNTQLSTEQVQDIVGAMVTGNTESGIAVTYEDSDGTLDFDVTVGSGSDPSGRIQYADGSGGFSSESNLSWDATNNQLTLSGSITGTASLLNGVTGHTQSQGDDSTKIATTRYVDRAKVKQQFNLSFSDDISTSEHWLSWRDQYEASSISSDLVDTNYLVPANGRVVAVYIRIGNITSSASMTMRVYSQNAGFMQSMGEEEAEAVSIIATGDKFEVFAFYFDDAEHFQAGDSIKVSIQTDNDTGGVQIYNVTALLEFDYTQMGRTDSGELA